MARTPVSALGVGTVVDHPFGLEWHRTEHVLPAPVPRRHELQQRVEQCQRLAVMLALFCLAQCFAQGVNGLGVTRLRGPHEVGRGRAETARVHQHPRRVTVKGPATCAADAAVDRLLDERVVDLIAQVAALLDFGDQASPHQPLEDRTRAPPATCH